MESHIEIKRAAILGIFANMFLAIIKIIVGFVTNSQAMIADSINSFSDIFSSLITYIGNRIASKPKDEDHPYGHGKSEYIFSFVIGISLILMALEIINNSINSYISNQHITYSVWLIIVVAITIIIKLSLYIYTKKLAESNKSILLKANMLDHRNDIFVSLAVLISILSSMCKIYILDIIVAIVISVWIIYTAIKIFVESYKVLMDTNINEETQNKIKEIALSVNNVSHVDEILTKPTGSKYLVIIKVSVPGGITVNESHKTAGIIRSRVNELEQINDTVVHINPC